MTTHFILNKKCSAASKNDLQEINVTFELVPPNLHRRNADERVIRAFKNHPLSGLATCHLDFTLREWGRLLHQAKLTLNLLRNS